MNQDLRNLRRQYLHEGLDIDELPTHPLILFDDWFTQQQETNPFDATAVTLATIGMSGYPESRIVLVKEYSDKGFLFFTNYKSQKGVAIAMDNKVSLLFYWPEHARQVRILGTAKKTDARTSDTYFKERPFESQISAYISQQSEKVESRRFLDDKFSETKANFTNETLKRPKDWGGYVVVPTVYEFWQGRENRLHDRILYKLKSNNWEMSRLAP